ncbi:MAG: formylglycine-generating enzyme family protein [Myxococcales bacterium]|nr:formylglycine-generating enzyme family protein [Myxococcales bacterium]
MSELDGPGLGVLLDAVRDGRQDPVLLEHFGVPWAEALGVDEFGLWARVTGMQLRWIVAGRYVRGSPPAEVGRLGDEWPRHEVELTRGFWLGATPLTQAVWESVMDDNPSSFQSPDRPVERVSWDDAQEFCKRLGAQVPGLGPRLPTAAEWEYACRAGSTEATYAGDLEGRDVAPVLDEIAWYWTNAGVDFELVYRKSPDGWEPTQRGTRVVGRKRPNAWGLHDMLGNVWEWCADGGATYSAEAVVDPVSSPGIERECRGASWLNVASYVRAACREHHPTSYRYGYLGFRLAAGSQLSARASGHAA